MADAAKKYEDFLSMPDEEFTNIVPPDEPIAESEEEEDTSQEIQETENTSADTEEVVNEDEEISDSTEEDSSEEESSDEDSKDNEQVDESVDQTDSTTDENKDEESTENTEDSEDADEENKEIDYKSFYDKVMAPFKANGKEIELKSPEEAVQLMQMGANYTKKMQAIQPYRKMLIMLENNNLMDEDKLSYLIDLDQKNPDAVHKLLKDSKIDPMDLDTDKESTYQTGNHQVSNEEAAFVNTLDDLKSTPDGLQTLQVINDNWDQPSKDVLWKNPELMGVIHSQKQNGIYDRIVSEYERQSVLGQIPAGTPFIKAYKAIGDKLSANGSFNDLIGSTNNVQSTTDQEPVAKTVTKPEPKVKNSDKANAASSTRSSPKQAKKVINPLSMSDDEFLKQMENRL